MIYLGQWMWSNVIIIHNGGTVPLVKHALGRPHPWRLATSIISFQCGTKHAARAPTDANQSGPNQKIWLFPRIISMDKGFIMRIMDSFGTTYIRTDRRYRWTGLHRFLAKYDWPLSHHLPLRIDFLTFANHFGLSRALFLTWTNGKNFSQHSQYEHTSSKGSPWWTPPITTSL